MLRFLSLRARRFIFIRQMLSPHTLPQLAFCLRASGFIISLATFTFAISAIAFIIFSRLRLLAIRYA